MSAAHGGEGEYDWVGDEASRYLLSEGRSGGGKHSRRGRASAIAGSVRARGSTGLTGVASARTIVRARPPYTHGHSVADAPAPRGLPPSRDRGGPELRGDDGRERRAGLADSRADEFAVPRRGGDGHALDLALLRRGARRRARRPLSAPSAAVGDGDRPGRGGGDTRRADARRAGERAGHLELAHRGGDSRGRAGGAPELHVRRRRPRRADERPGLARRLDAGRLACGSLAVGRSSRSSGPGPRTSSSPPAISGARSRSFARRRARILAGGRAAGRSISTSSR